MLHKLFNFLSICLILGLSLILASCGSKLEPSLQTTPGIAVGITSSTCPSIEVKLGDQVMWTNQDKAGHVVQADKADGSKVFDSGILQEGDTFTFVFTESGRFEYICSSDGGMSGTITVGP